MLEKISNHEGGWKNMNKVYKKMRFGFGKLWVDLVLGRVKIIMSGEVREKIMHEG